MKYHHILQFCSPAVLPGGLILFSAFSNLVTPVQSFLKVQSLSWLLLAAVLSLRIGIRHDFRDYGAAWTVAGPYAAFIAFWRITIGMEASPWLMALLPVLINLTSPLEKSKKCICLSEEVCTHGQSSAPRGYMLVVIGSATLIMNTSDTRPETFALSICSVMLLAFFLDHSVQILRSHFVASESEPLGIKSMHSSDEGTSLISNRKQAHLIRTVAESIFICCFILSFAMEGKTFSGASSLPTHFRSASWRERLFQDQISAFSIAVVIELLKNISLVSSLCRYSAIETGLLVLGGTLVSQIVTNNDAFDYILMAIYGFGSAKYFSRTNSTLSWTKTQQWRSEIPKYVMIFAIITIFLQKRAFWQIGSNGFSETQALEFKLPLESFGYVEITDSNTHPIQQLMKSADDDFMRIRSKQSKTLTDAVYEYRQRYGVHPPPKFDVWFEFATKNNIILTDEFDSIFHDMMPFWALEPKLLRHRVSEALGFDNGLLGILIRGGQISHVGISGVNSPEHQNISATDVEEQTEAIVRMLQSFVHHLPDMDLAFNLHDEPRIILQHNRLSKLVDIATNQAIPLALSHGSPRNTFSSRPEDMNDGYSIEEVRETRFNRFARQSTWSHARLSCPPDSPAQDVINDSPTDNVTSWAFGPLGFVMNVTGLTDICQSPSLASTHGFFQRPNVFNIAQDLLPVFSPSKFSSFSDILYPPSWYWAQRTTYDPADDMSWEEKNSTLYWRGSTTGGFSRRGGWRKHHRQRAIRTLTANDNTYILQQGESTKSSWESSHIGRQTLGEYIDVGFTHIGQCDPSDCAAQTEFFHIHPSGPQSEAWGHKLLLDMDGNAFSGRFSSFVSSGSAVAKMGVVKEALIGDWIKPWVHYVPLSMKGGEWMEVVRYFLSGSSDLQKRDDQETDLGQRVDPGDEAARKIARDGSQWASQALRKVDLEVWMFRLLLEYARVMDDARDQIGYSMN